MENWLRTGRGSVFYDVWMTFVITFSYVVLP